MPVYPELSDFLRNDPQRQTEIALYDYFQENLPSNYNVIYGAEWICNSRGQGLDELFDPLTNETAGGYFPLGEVDFILLAPKGLLVIEVKGGGVILENGVWYSIDRYGDRHQIENPLVQARKNMFAVLRTLTQSRIFYNRFINIGYAVILPHTRSWHPAIRDQNLFIFRESIGNLLENMDQIIGRWARIWENAGRMPEKLAEGDINHIVSIFAPTTRLRRPKLGRQIEEFQRQVVTLTEEQFGVLKNLAGNRKAVITGGAGTGKTLLAMEKARQTARQGHKTLFTCPNRLLSRHVKEHLRTIDNLQVMNFHELCYRWGVKAGIENLIDPDGAERKLLTQEDYFKRFPEVLFDAADKIADRFEAIIVDEAQDMKEIYWISLQHCLAEEEPIFYIFCDPNQAIWHIGDSLPFDTPVFHLNLNLRNSRRVFEAMVGLRGGDGYELARGTADGEFKIISINAFDLSNRLVKLLSTLVGQGVPRNSIAIITGRSEEKSIFADRMTIGHHQLTRSLLDIEDKIMFSSVRRFRGMEAAAVIMVEIDYLVDLAKLREELGDRFEPTDDGQIQEIAKETLLIGMSRAQHSLYILADDWTNKKLGEMGLPV